MNYKKKGLLKLLRDIINDKVKKIIITYRDRLLRFGMELIEYICRIKNIELVVIHKDNPKTFGADLVEDMLSIVTVYSSKMYGRRSHQKKQALKNAAANA